MDSNRTTPGSFRCSDYSAAQQQSLSDLSSIRSTRSLACQVLPSASSSPTINTISPQNNSQFPASCPNPRHLPQRHPPGHSSFAWCQGSSAALNTHRENLHTCYPPGSSGNSSAAQSSAAPSSATQLPLPSPALAFQHSNPLAAQLYPSERWGFESSRTSEAAPQSLPPRSTVPPRPSSGAARSTAFHDASTSASDRDAGTCAVLASDLAPDRQPDGGSRSVGASGTACTSRRDGCTRSSKEHHGSPKRPRSLSLFGNDSDDFNLLQLRGAICSSRRRRLPSNTDQHPKPRSPSNESSDKDASLDMLEDSLIGNDVLVEECRHRSRQLRGLVQPCLGNDQHSQSCVILEQPSKLEQCGMFPGLTAQQLERMVGPQCLQLKPYQLATLGFFSSLMQRSIRGCVLATEARLGARTQIAVWLAVLKCSNTKPMPVVPSYFNTARSHAPHTVALVLAPPASLPSWRTIFHRWAPSLSVVSFEGSLAASNIENRLREYSSLITASTGQSHCSTPAATMASVPFDVLLVPHTAATEALVKQLEAVPWLLTLLEGASQLDREQFRLLRPILANAHQRIALEKDCVSCSAHDAPALRNLIELVHPQVFDARQGHTLALVHCASQAAEADEAKRMRDIIAPYVLQLRASALVHQWTPRQHVQRTSIMPSEQALLYSKYTAKHTFLLGGEAATSDGCGNVSETSAHDSEDSEVKVLKAFMWLYRVAQHPLLVRSRYGHDKLLRISQECERAKMFCADNQDASCPVASLATLSDMKLHTICCALPHLHHLKLPSDAILSSSKCASLLQLLRQARSPSSGSIVIASSFSSILDVCEHALSTIGCPHARIDSSMSEDACHSVECAFHEGRVRVVVLQHAVAVQRPELNLSCAHTCLFYDSGINLAADKAVEACCMRLEKQTATTFCRLITQSSIDERVANFPRRRHQHHISRCRSSHSSQASSPMPVGDASHDTIPPLVLLREAVLAELVEKHTQATDVSGHAELPPAKRLCVQAL